MTECERNRISVTCLCRCLKLLSNRVDNSIEKVQLSDMGSYQCVAKSEERDVMSQEGSIQLEGEFIFSSATLTSTIRKEASCF